MKRCPTCDKTFEDNLRFCQSCGSPLADAVEELDPYKTMVARPEDIAAAIPPLPEAEPPKPADDVLELPTDFDANKTQIVSESELRAEFAKQDQQVVDVPPPEPPKFIEPTPPPPPPVASAAPPKAPEEPKAPEPTPSSPFANDLTGDPFLHTTPPIPSPFEKSPSPTPEPAGQRTVEPAAPPAEMPSPFGNASSKPEKTAESLASEPLGEAGGKIEQAEWTPPPVPDASRQNQEIGQNTPLQPPAAGGQSKTLAIVSLILGILGFTLCCGTVLPSLIAIITGFMARGKASKDPANYGGAGLALVGILTGLLGLLLSVAYLVWVFLFGGMQMLMQGM